MDERIVNLKTVVRKMECRKYSGSTQEILRKKLGNKTHTRSTQYSGHTQEIHRKYS